MLIFSYIFNYTILKYNNFYGVNKKSILLFLPADNFNEDEFLTTSGLLKKSGYQVFIASDAICFCTGSNGIKVKNDINIMNVHPGNFSAIVIIGGNGIKKYWNNKLLHKTVTKFYLSNKIIAAICAAPVVFAKAGLLKNVSAVCYPDVVNELLSSGAVLCNTSVCVSNKIITAAMPKNANEFAQCLINELKERLK